MANPYMRALSFIECNEDDIGGEGSFSVYPGSERCSTARAAFGARALNVTEIPDFRSGINTLRLICIHGIAGENGCPVLAHCLLTHGQLALDRIPKSYVART